MSSCWSSPYAVPRIVPSPAQGAEKPVRQGSTSIEKLRIYIYCDSTFFGVASGAARRGKPDKPQIRVSARPIGGRLGRWNLADATMVRLLPPRRRLTPSCRQLGCWSR
jgi:hypothetical protein